MDLSKLPKLSDTKAAEGEPTPTPPEPVPTAPLPVMPARPPIGAADTWVSIGVGLFVLLFWPRFLQWASSRVFHTHFDEFESPPGSGNIVPYQTLPEFWSDLGPTLLGIVLVVDGLLLFTRRPALILIALCLTGASTLFNLGWVIYSYNTYGLAPVSALGVIFGGFILSTQWLSFKAANAARAARRAALQAS